MAPITDVPGLWKRAVVEDPWGTRLELVQDPDLLGLHHVTLVVPDPEASLEWLVHALGGDRTKLKGQIDAIRYRDLSVFYLFAVKGIEPPQARATRSITLALARWTWTRWSTISRGWA